MPVAQIIPFAERRTMSRREAPAAPMGVVLPFRRPGTRLAEASARPVVPAGPTVPDEDRVAGRGRDPG